MKRVIVSGATSMLGVSLIKECIANKTEVVALVRPNSANFNRLPDSKYITIIECNLRALSDLEVDEAKGFDVFYHFGWEGTSKSDRENTLIQFQNIGYTLDAVNLTNRIGCKRFVGAGSQAEYGRVNEKVISPSSATNPEIAYGVAKLSAGKLSALLAQQLGVEHIWTRVFSVYGPHDNANTMIMSALDKMLRHQPTQFTKCEQTWDYLYTDDAARAFYLIGSKGKPQSVYCLGSGQTKVLSEYIKVIQDKTATPLSSGIGEIPYSNNQVMNLCADISSLTSDVGFSPSIDFESGISQMIDWYKTVNSQSQESIS